MSGQRDWVFTLNADMEDGEHITWLAPSKDGPLDWMDKNHKIRYMIYQVEKAPTTGQIHLQGYLQMTDKTRLSALKKLDNAAHWEPRYGTHEEARKYCMKEGALNGPWERGDPVVQGQRTDLIQLYDSVKAGKTNLELLEEDARIARYAKEISYMRFALAEPLSDRQLQGVRVIVSYGPTGTGKTYAAINNIANGNDYYIAECPSTKNGKLWFDGYENQKTLILDDFDSDYCTLAFLKRILDKYKLKVEVKGGHRWAVWTTVVITSNTPPWSWYSKGLDPLLMVDIGPLRRRINEIRYHTQQGLYQLQEWEGKLMDFVSYDAPLAAADAGGVTKDLDSEDEDMWQNNLYTRDSQDTQQITLVTE